MLGPSFLDEWLPSERDFLDRHGGGRLHAFASFPLAGMAELADAGDLKSLVVIPHAGSSPALGTPHLR